MKRHHKEDVIVGSALGAACAFVTYRMFWPSPFSRTSFAPDCAGTAKVVYGAETEGARDHHLYELGQLHDEVDVV
jgi:diacylglycerol diphosphate phosphatase/phosphatidate phosphatase